MPDTRNQISDPPTRPLTATEKDQCFCRIQRPASSIRLGGGRGRGRAAGGRPTPGGLMISVFVSARTLWSFCCRIPAFFALWRFDWCATGIALTRLHPAELVRTADCRCSAA
jgi:hypothetical protein